VGRAPSPAADALVGIEAGPGRLARIMVRAAPLCHAYLYRRFYVQPSPWSSRRTWEDLSASHPE